MILLVPANWLRARLVCVFFFYSVRHSWHFEHYKDDSVNVRRIKMIIGRKNDEGNMRRKNDEREHEAKRRRRQKKLRFVVNWENYMQFASHFWSAVAGDYGKPTITIISNACNELITVDHFPISVNIFNSISFPCWKWKHPLRRLCLMLAANSSDTNGKWCKHPAIFIE